MEYSEKLKELSTYAAVSGNEEPLSMTLKELFANYCDSVEIDKFYNVIGLKKGSGSKKHKIMITAHYDEIGFFVKSIDEKGFLRVANIGGIDSKIMLAQEVVVHGKKQVTGIIGAKPPHLLQPDETKKAVKIEDLSVDVGMGYDKVKEIISIGDIITLKSIPFDLQGNKVSSKSIDNRCGVLALLQMMEELSTLNIEDDIYFVATTQEEFHLTGVMTSAYNIEPDAAIVIDACHGDMPDAPKDETYPLGKGPAVGMGPILHRKLMQRIIDIAKDENIPYQIDIEAGDTGTEAWATQVSRAGIPTILLSIPVRYMHTTIETVNMADIKNTARLAARFINKAGSELEAILCY